MDSERVAVCTRVCIDWMIRRHMPEVLEVERHRPEKPWEEEDFLRRLRQRNCIGMVADKGSHVLGFMVYELLPQRINVLRFAVHPDHRRQQVGRQLIDKLKYKLSSHRRTRIDFRVREANLPAQLFLRAMGFLAVEVLRDTEEYLFRYKLPEEL